MAIFEPGKCDCPEAYISCTPGAAGSCTFGNCILEGASGPFNVPATVPIKTLLKGSSVSPWVRLRFESDKAPWSVGQPGLNVPPSFWDYTEITTGNISQPGCSNPANKRPRAGLTRTQIAAAVGGGNTDPNNPGTLDTNNSAIYESCEETCRAAIKSFQYSWGTVDSGAKCRVTIMDELGSSLNAWIGRLFRNPTNTPTTPVAQAQPSTDTVPQGVYKMKVTFGWLVLGGEDGNACPIDGSFYGPASCTPSVYVSDTGWTSWSTAGSRLICSPPMWFLPDQLVINVQNGRYVYEIEGIDLMGRAQNQPSARSYGSSTNKMHFALAVKKMCAECNPAMEVEFAQLSPDGQFIEPMLFTVPTNSAAVGGLTTTQPIRNLPTPVPPGVPANPTGGELTKCLPANIRIQDIPTEGGISGSFIGTCQLGYRRAFERLGPMDVWQCHELGPLATIHQWINRTTAQGIVVSNISTVPPRGIVMNYDPTYVSDVIINVGTSTSPSLIPKRVQGRVMLWANPHPNCAQTVTGTGQIKAVYIVNGGACSPVMSFNPTMKWNFQAAVAAGGTTGPTSGRMAGTADARQGLQCRIPGRSLRIEAIVPVGTADEGGRSATSSAVITAGAHRNANLLHHAIEAELKVQGDPSDYLCSPIFGFGRSIAIVVINPFYLDGDATNGCSVSWRTLTSSSCNSILTSRNWFIKGVDHQIKEGSYITTYKLILFAPNAELNAVRAGNTPVALGGEVEAPTGSAPGRFACAQGTLPCIDPVTSPYGPRGTLAYTAGTVGTRAGADTWCEAECTNAIGPT